MGGLSDRLLESELPVRVYGRRLEPKLIQYHGYHEFMDECKAMGIQVLGPDVNESILKFSVDKNKNIRFGLGAVKGVGESAVQNIIEERKKNGPYKSIFDFVERVNLTACNKKNIESGFGRSVVTSVSSVNSSSPTVEKENVLGYLGSLW